MSIGELAGVWRLKAFEFTDAKGGVFLPLGEQPQGALVVSADGYAVISFSASDRSRFASDDVFAGTLEERAAAAAGYVSFGGPCEVTDTAISVEVEQSSFPNWVGGKQVRLYERRGNRLTLRTSGPRLFGGVERSGRAELERM
ncbi:MAG: lipocalin-like domain-containing protein [Hyphomicrobiales bacterium]|nr:lipocalin-like domain-containing protein [Hyphomicrobiales bacterium]